MKRFSSPRLLLLAAAISASAVVACTVTTTKDPSADPGTATGGGDGGAASSDGGRGTSDGGAGSGNARIGTVSLTQVSYDVGNTPVSSYTAFASFTEATTDTAPAGGSDCNISTEGACSITECTLAEAADAGAPASDAGAPPKQPHAGDITVSATEDVTLAPNADGTYAFASGQVKLFGSGEQIDVDAKGAEIPAFTKSLTAPTLVKITAPAWPAAGQPFVVERTQPITMKWAPGQSGDVKATVTSLAGNKMASVACTFAASAGEGTIPAAALGKLMATTTQGSISVSATSSTTVKAGDWDVTIMATSPASAGAALASSTANIK